jgi:hypothetical protein
MKFVAGDSAAAGNEGHPISTLSDTFRQMRKVSSTLSDGHTERPEMISTNQYGF